MLFYIFMLYSLCFLFESFRSNLMYFFFFLLTLGRNTCNLHDSAPYICKNAIAKFSLYLWHCGHDSKVFKDGTARALLMMFILFPGFLSKAYSYPSCWVCICCLIFIWGEGCVERNVGRIMHFNHAQCSIE